MGSSKRTTVQKNEMPAWQQRAHQDLLKRTKGIAGQEYTPYTGNRVVNLTGNEMRAMGAASDFGQNFSPFMDKANMFLGQSAKSFTDADMSQYMNPYIDQAIRPAARELEQQYDRTRNRLNAQSVSRGAFGGRRNDLMQKDAQENYLQSVGDLWSRGRAQAFDVGAQQFNQDRAAAAGASQGYSDLGRYAMGTMLGAGALQRGVQQQQEDFKYQQHLEDRDWRMNRLAPHMQAVHGIPVLQNQTQTAPGPDRFGQVLGAAATGVGAFFGMSSKTFKEKIKETDSVLDKVKKLPVYNWEYKPGYGPVGLHYGPMAEDFNRVFGTSGGKMINLVDAIGTTMAAVKELSEQVDGISKKKSGGPLSAV